MILHIDMNSYFASVEQQDNPDLRGKPIVVGGRDQNHSVVCAASIEAKKYGIKSGMSSFEAKRLCPFVIFVSGDSEKYLNISQQIFSIFRRFTYKVEIFSVDEAFLEIENDPAGVALGIKKYIKEEIGERLTCSIGIAKNKLLAKLASEKKKPDGLTIINDQNLDQMLFSSKLDDFCGIGRQTLKHLNSMGIFTVFQLRQTPLNILTISFGPAKGQWLFNTCRGVDDSKLIPGDFSSDQKSFSHNLTLDKATSDLNKIKETIFYLAQKTARRMRCEGFAGKTVSLYLRYPDFGGLGWQKNLGEYVENGDEIYKVCIAGCNPEKSVRMISVGVGNLTKREFVNQDLLLDKKKNQNILMAYDAICDRFGENAVFYGCSMLTFARDHAVGIRTKFKI